MRSEDFANILRRVDKPLMIYNKSGFLTAKHQYLISYKGFAFYTKTSEQIDLPGSVEGNRCGEDLDSFVTLSDFWCHRQTGNALGSCPC